MQSRRTLRPMYLAGLIVIAVCVGTLAGENDKPSYPKPPSAKDVKVMPAGWKRAPNKPATAAEIDALLAKELKRDHASPAPLTTDEQFIRRVTLDLTGKLPGPGEVQAFVGSRESQKRSQLIDRLLASDDYCRHWARYWKDVVVSRATDMRLQRLYGPFEEWLYEQFQANKNWGDIASAMITAQGLYLNEPPKVALNDEEDIDEANPAKKKLKKKALEKAQQKKAKEPPKDETPKPEKTHNGAAYFLLAHSGADGPVERAAETSRVFLGIQIQCAQCHDHPTDIWKRTQFHEMAAFYARMREKRIRPQAGQRLGIEIVSVPQRREYEMPGQDDPKQTTVMHPKFLTGQAIPHGQGDEERREALAKLMTSKDNYWFSAAYVNRVWGELMGQGFYQPVDNMGPLQDATYPEVLMRLAASFRATNYDVKELFRTVMNTQTYQRQIRLGDSPDDHLHFAASYPSRLRADALWESLNSVLGPFDRGPREGPRRGPGGPMRPGGGGLQGMVKEMFGFDPSTKSDEVEGSVSQALLLMNNQTINQRITTRGNTALAEILREKSDDSEAVQALYLRTLARKPTANELEKCRDYVKDVGDRREAFEDILWSLINSTEFQTKR